MRRRPLTGRRLADWDRSALMVLAVRSYSSKYAFWSAPSQKPDRLGSFHTSKNQVRTSAFPVALLDVADEGIDQIFPRRPGAGCEVLPCQ